MLNKRTMIGPVLVSAMLLMLSVKGSGQAPSASWDAARGEIERLIKASGAETVAVAVDDPSTGRRMLINEHVVLHSASMMKVPVMMEIYRLASEGKLKLTDRIRVKNRFASIVDGSEYGLSAEDDSDTELYSRAGEELPLSDLVEIMITKSSNLATNLLIERVGADSVTALVRRLGAENLTVRRGVEDSKAFRAGLNNVATAFDLMLMFRTIAECRFIPARYCREMTDVLLRQQFKESIPAGLPEGVRFAHKTGTITKIKHDGGIAYTPGRKPYVIVILTRGFDDGKNADVLMAGIASIVHRAITSKQ
jgi:beta-lactamase class A